jgi:hypothetical protein
LAHRRARNAQTLTARVQPAGRPSPTDGQELADSWIGYSTLVGGTVSMTAISIRELSRRFHPQGSPRRLDEPARRPCQLPRVGSTPCYLTGRCARCYLAGDGNEMADIARLPGRKQELWERQTSRACREWTVDGSSTREAERGPQKDRRDARRQGDLRAQCPVINPCRGAVRSRTCSTPTDRT